MTASTRRASRYGSAIVYWGIARHLPWSPRPGGAAARRLRAFLASRMLDECGSNVNVERGAFFGSGKGVRLGSRSDIGMDALIIGPVAIGQDVMMGPRCILLADRHDIGRSDIPMNQQGFLEPALITIEDDVFLGAGVIVLHGVTIGRGSVVGAGAVVAKSVPPYCIAAGNPARVVKKRLP